VHAHTLGVHMGMHEGSGAGGDGGMDGDSKRARASDSTGRGDEGARERESRQVARGHVSEVVRGPGQGEGKRWHWQRQ
jgi:hypothetical protein